MAKKDTEETEGSEETTEETEETSEEEESEEDSKESEEDSDESSDEDGEEAPEQFYDPNKVPKELKGAFKKMQASYVGKMQKFADDIRRGEAFNELTQIPEFRLFVSDMESGKGYGASSAYAGNGKRGKEEEEDSDELPAGKEGKLDMNKLVKALGPVIDKIVAERVGPLTNRIAERTLEDLKERHPDFDHYLPEITKLRKKHPTMDYQEAYDLVSGSSRRPKVNKEALDKAKKARTEGSGSGKGGVETLTPKTAKTIKEALAIAAREQGFSV